jgi:hypothetical protein
MSFLLPFLALGETAIFSVLLIFLLLVPATILTLINSIMGKRSVIMVICAVTAAIFGIWGVVDGLKLIVIDWHTSDDWPPSKDFVFSFLPFAFFLTGGLIALVRMWKTKRGDESSTKAKS